MKPKVYVETTFVSYLTGWASRDVVVAGMQQITREWWQDYREHFDLYASELVIQEAGAGDPAAAQERLDVLATMPLLRATEEALKLAQQLVGAGALPPKAAQDAAHIAIAAVNKMDYLLTWNCKHLANATMRGQIEEACEAAGFRPPVICTPHELTEDEHAT